jgi:predicted N-formylglutamate amidohydrolase
MKPLALIITGEHAVNYIPEVYEHYFEGNQALLQTHRGIDFGTQAIAESMSRDLGCTCHLAKTCRLLIDLNRSLSHRACFSEISANFSREEKNHLIEMYYLPYREQAERDICALIAKGHQVLHLSIHSFTPVLNEQIRTTDIGLLYDPKRPGEKMLATRWQYLLKQLGNTLRVRLNYPYKGNTDGFTTSLRKKFPEADYLGLEVECNQAITREPYSLTLLITTLTDTLKIILKENLNDV